MSCFGYAGRKMGYKLIDGLALYSAFLPKWHPR